MYCRIKHLQLVYHQASVTLFRNKCRRVFGKTTSLGIQAHIEPCVCFGLPLRMTASLWSLRCKALTFEVTDLTDFLVSQQNVTVSHSCGAVLRNDKAFSAIQSDRGYENHLMGRIRRNFDNPDERIYPAYQAVPVFKISVHALLQKTH